MRIRLLALTTIAGVALATAGHAAPTTKPQIEDPAGDAVGGQAGTDIVSVLYTTEGKGTGKAYVPKKLVVTMTLAGPVVTDPGFTYEVEATTDTCGDVAFTFEPGTPYESVTGLNGWAVWGSCRVGDSSYELLTVKANGSTVTWTFSLKASPLEIGTVFEDFRARVDPTVPVVPLPSSDTQTELGLVDGATGDGTWTVG